MAGHDFTQGILGRYVPATAGTVNWPDGCKTILPAIYDKSDPDTNICKDLDAPLVVFLAKQQPSDTGSSQVTHLAGDSLDSIGITGAIGESLRHNKPVVIRNASHGTDWIDLTAEFLDVRYGISPDRYVCMTDIGARAREPLAPFIHGTIAEFFSAMDDPGKIQCILDIPLAHVTLPEALRTIDHGLVFGWNETTQAVPVTSDVHPDNFTSKGWGVLHQPGVVTHPHQDAEGTATWTRVEAGIKMWVVFKQRGRFDDRMHREDIACRLTDVMENQKWLEKHCEAEVITLHPGDMIIQPPGTLHAVYTPTPSFCTGGHFYHYECMHLTELARCIDAAQGDATTNQHLSHALETLRRMVIATPSLSPRIPMYRRPLLSLCLMSLQGQQYRAKGGKIDAAIDRETAAPAKKIADAILKWQGVSRKAPAEAILHAGNQYDAGPRLDTDELRKVLKKHVK